MKKLAIGIAIALAIVAVVGILLGPQLFPTQPSSVPSNGDSTVPTPTNGASNSEVEELLYDRTWISPGKVHVGNFYPGARAEWSLSVHNGKDTATSFAITYRYPDHVGEGYVKPAVGVQDWVIIADPTPVLAPKETREILVVLAMPEDAVVFAPKWEFWISVMDTTQVGMVQTELCSRWLVTMRQ